LRPGRGAGYAAPMAGSFKTEAIVLRSIRYGEADRVLHLYSATRGRIGAIAKGSRRPRSRFGGRLEPFFRLDMVLYEGRGELATVTSAHTVAAHPNLRANGPALGAAARACDAVLRLLDGEEANPGAYNLLGRYLAQLDGSESVAEDGSADGAAGLAAALAFRLKLALAAGFAPELASCARCGERDGLSGFSGAAGGVVCSACERDGFPLSGEARGFMIEALGRPLAQAPSASERALRQAERAVTETLSHHAHVHLRAAA
jgi:DNA repair protein RecO (recombination protein O)